MKTLVGAFSRINFVVLLLLDEVARLVSVCPSMCHQMACTTGVLSCPDGGLAQIPQFLPPGTIKIILTNHHFLNTRLQYSNLSNYGPPQFKVAKITIQNCGLVNISSNTFSHLTDLSILDLANNALSEIVPDTFRSLTLHFLRLDGNRHLVLRNHSFRGLIVSTLSLIDCGLASLPFDTINEISGSLKKLYLTNNKIHVIDTTFRDIFEHLTVIQINDNPFNCTCRLHWLSSVLLWRRIRYSGQETSVLTSEPQCSEPPTHKEKLLINLSTSDFNCHIPRLKLVDVHMISNSSARLTCTSKREPHEDPMVQWFFKQGDRLVYRSQARETAALSVTGRATIDYFLCIITNANGNVTVLVKVHWPGLWSNKSGATLSNKDQSVGITLFSFPNSSSKSPDIHSKRFTLLEMIGSVVGTFTLTMVLFLCIYKHMVRAMRREHKKKWYIAYEPTCGSDSQTYDVPTCAMGSYYSGQLFSNHSSPIRYENNIRADRSFSPMKTAIL